MKVFIAGASGAIGRPLVAQLCERGHQVVGMTRSEERAVEICDTGAEAAIADALDPGGVRAAVEACRPDVVVNELTDLDRPLNPRRYAEWLEGTNRLRTEGTRNLVDAARTVDARLISQSVAFAYSFEPGVKSEDAPLIGSEAGAMADAIKDLEQQTLDAGGIVLRYGFFYGPGTAYARDGQQIAMIEKRQMPIIGGGRGVFPFIHVDDAASATVAAIERGQPGVYNIADDEPAAGKDWIPYVAELVGADKPRRIPKWIARFAAGQLAVMATQLQPVSNAKARRELDWEPRHKSWREGFKAELA